MRLMYIMNSVCEAMCVSYALCLMCAKCVYCVYVHYVCYASSWVCVVDVLCASSVCYVCWVHGTCIS